VTARRALEAKIVQRHSAARYLMAIGTEHHEMEIPARVKRGGAASTAMYAPQTGHVTP
jgi:hypothetical protein